MVGRHYMFHNAIALVALSRHENPTQFQKTLTINDFYLGAPDYEFPLGKSHGASYLTATMRRDVTNSPMGVLTQTAARPDWYRNGNAVSPDGPCRHPAGGISLRACEQ